MLCCSCLHLFELLKKLFGTVRETTVESLHNVQAYLVLRMKFCVSYDSRIAYEGVALDGNILKYTELCYSVSDGSVCIGICCYSCQPRVV